MRSARLADPLLLALGRRIRDRRWALEVTVKELAEQAGLSERFVVAIENGYANVSVLNVCAIADVLHTDASTLLENVKRIAPRTRTVVALVGLRGAGKSTIGRLAAEELRLPFVELDARITERAGMSAGEIFDVHGAAYYRKLERAEVGALIAAPDSAIVSTAGSLVTDHVTYDLLLEKTTVVWLRATAEDHHDRVLAQGDKRPMEHRKDAMEELRAILRARRALYERAHYVIDTSKLGLARSVLSLTRIARGELAERKRRRA